MSLCDRQRVIEIRMWAERARQITHDHRDDDGSLQSELFYQDIVDLCDGKLPAVGEIVEDREELLLEIKELNTELDDVLRELETYNLE